MASVKNGAVLKEDAETSQLDIIAADDVDEIDCRRRVDEETMTLLLAIAYSIVKIMSAAAMEYQMRPASPRQGCV